MYSGLLIILVPFFLGYAVKITFPSVEREIHRALNICVYLILFLMGVSLAQLDNLDTYLQQIAFSSLLVFICVFGCNFIVLALIDIFLPWRINTAHNVVPSHMTLIQESVQICSALVIGFLIGLFPLPYFHYASKVSEIVLITLLFLVGVQLRTNGMTLRQILINKVGITTTIVLVLSALVGGAISAFILGIPVKAGLALASSFGWYSLSSILMTEYQGPVIGSIAFFNDLFREIFSVLLIPALIRRYRITALGLCGATSLDFTLPILQKNGGISIVPAAIVQGFLLSLLVPVLLTFLNT